MKKAVIYVHGKGGNTDEAKHYEHIFENCYVWGLPYTSQTPWEAETEFKNLTKEIFENYDRVALVANSIGAYFSMSALNTEKLCKAFFISPVIDMEKLIRNMMTFANVSEDDLRIKKQIVTDFGETLSWDYLLYAKENKPVWNVPTHILYGENDNLTDFETVSNFSKSISAKLEVMPCGEHWFHTEEQMMFLDNWIKKNL